MSIPDVTDIDQFAVLPTGVRICYRDTGSADGPPLVLVAGLGQHLTAWPQAMLAAFTERGYRIIRFDNRDVGRSSSIAKPPPNPFQLLRSRPRPDTYLLRDMAADVIGLLDHLGVSRAHLVGMSMGGMIAQTVASNWPERVRTLTSMISTTGSPHVGQPTLLTKLLLMRPPAKGRDGMIRRHLGMVNHLAGPDFPIDREAEIAYAEDAWDRAGGDASAIGAGVARQIQAIQASGDRTTQLTRISAPTLVIHGDHDPIVNPSGGKATAAAISRAKLTIVPGMGHQLAPGLTHRLVDSITVHTLVAA